MQSSEERRKQFLAEERAYWSQRDELLSHHEGQWVAIVGGQVVAVGDQMNQVARDAFSRTGSPVMFVTLVGEEDFEITVRQVAAGRYDREYVPTMPKVVAAVSDMGGGRSGVVDFIVDTGADITVLTDRAAEPLELRMSPIAWARVGGLTGARERRILYGALVTLAGKAVTVTADLRADIAEDILGRDVINEYELTLCAQDGVVRFRSCE